MLTFLSLLMIGIGGFFAYAIWDSDAREYPGAWWHLNCLWWSGLIMLGTIWFFPLTSSYIWVTTIAGAILALIGFLIGNDDEEWAAAVWVGLGTIASSLLILLFDSMGLSASFQAGFLITTGIVLNIVGGGIQRPQQNGYDVAWSIGTMLLITGIFVFTGVVKTPLRHLNTVLVPAHNQAIDHLEEMRANYEAWLPQAQACQQVIETEYAQDAPAELDIANQAIANGTTHRDTASTHIEQARGTATEYTEYSDESRDALIARTAHAQTAYSELEAGVERLSRVCSNLESLEITWERTYEWFEIAAYWPNESSDRNYSACYYSEHYGIINADDTFEEVIIDDASPEQCTGLFGSCPDYEGQQWKVFEWDDYVYLVNEGIVPAMDKENPSQTEIGYYLCGADPTNGEFGALGEPPVSIIKELGESTPYLDDASNARVGDYRFGYWCYDQSGQIAEITETAFEEADYPEGVTLEWCWHHDPNGSTGYYYWYRGGVYQQYGRRCIDCSTTSYGGSVIRDRELSTMNNTDPMNVSPARGGGPGSGK